MGRATCPSADPRLTAKGVMRGARVVILVLLASLLKANDGLALDCDPPPPGLVGWWPGDGNAREVRGGVDGMLRNGATFAPGVVGEAFSFGGANDFVETGARTWGISTSATVTAWINTSEPDGTVFSLAHGLVEDEMLLRLVSGRIAIFNHKSSGNFAALQSDRLVNTGGWVFVAGVLNGGGAAGLEIFVNGDQEAGTLLTQGTPTDIVDTTPRKARIGWGLTEVAGEHFTGRVDEVELFNRALSADEIKKMFDAGMAGTCKLAHFLCYKASPLDRLPKFHATTKELKDQLGGPEPFVVKTITSICNPAGTNGEGITFPDVHQEGFEIAAPKGAAKFVRSDHVTVDQFGTLKLTITRPVTLLDVTPAAIGGPPPDRFPADPTGDPSVNRFKCYRAVLAKGQPRFVPPPDPTVTDELFSRAVHLVKVSKLCLPVDMNGETPGAETRAGHLVCYEVRSPENRAFTAQVQTNSASFGPHDLIARVGSRPSAGTRWINELCVPAIKDPP